MDGFGSGPLSESEAAGDAPSDEALAIVVVDPDPGLRNDVEDFEDDFERQVIAMDSMDFDLEAAQDVLEAGVFVIAADLGIRAGVDLLEAVRAHEPIAERPILIALDAPTRESVRWAISLGADSVCRRPYDADEIRVRLDAITAKAAAGAS